MVGIVLAAIVAACLPDPYRRVYRRLGQSIGRAWRGDRR
jgi:hypothetical protein